MTDKRDQENPQTVLTADLALVSYLDTLLAEIDESPKPVSVAAPVQAKPVQVDTLQESQVECPEPVQTATTENTPEAKCPALPGWAETPFQVLMFSLNGVDMAVPLSELLGILPLEGRINRLPGQPPWAMGVVVNRGDKVVVVNTCALLMPHQARQPAGVESHRHLLLIGDGQLGLVVDGLNGTQMLEKEAVQWRGNHGKRHPWYAGVITERLAAVIDVDGVLGMLAA